MAKSDSRKGRRKDRAEEAFSTLSAPRKAPRPASAPPPPVVPAEKPLPSGAVSRYSAWLLLIVALGVAIAFAARESRSHQDRKDLLAAAAEDAGGARALVGRGDLPAAVLALSRAGERLAPVEEARGVALELAEHVGRLEAEREARGIRIAELEEELRGRADRIAGLTLDLGERVATIAALEEDLRDRAASVADLQQDLDGVLATLENTNRRLGLLEVEQSERKADDDRFRAHLARAEDLLRAGAPVEARAELARAHAGFEGDPTADLLTRAGDLDRASRIELLRGEGDELRAEALASLDVGGSGRFERARSRWLVTELVRRAERAETRGDAEEAATWHEALAELRAGEKMGRWHGWHARSLRVKACLGRAVAAARDARPAVAVAWAEEAARIDPVAAAETLAWALRNAEKAASEAGADGSAGE